MWENDHTSVEMFISEKANVSVFWIETNNNGKWNERRNKQKKQTFYERLGNLLTNRDFVDLVVVAAN